MSLADQAKLAQDPYQFCVANFEMRTVDRELRTITFHLRDDSTVTFNVRYEVADGSQLKEQES